MSAIPKESNRLSTRDHWSEKWQNSQQAQFDPTHHSFRETHKFFLEHLPQGPGVRLLEVGTHPGRFLAYFHNHFKHDVTGMEYVDWCCDETRENMAQQGIPAEIINADLFDYELESKDEGWDIVCSFGLVEHFSDTREVVQKHLDLVRPGGLLALTIPNHSGINGPLMKVINREQHAAHNLMSYEDLHKGVLDTEGAEVIAGGYLGRLGFWNVGLYPRIAGTGMAYPFLRAPFYLAEKAGRVLPNSKLLSPNAAIIARKHDN